MAERKRLAVEYSSSSLNSASQIITYLRSKFSENEVKKFFQLLKDFEQIIGIYPTLYPESSKKKIRRAILSKELSIYYFVDKKRINVIAIVDNRWEKRRNLR